MPTVVFTKSNTSPVSVKKTVLNTDLKLYKEGASRVFNPIFLKNS
jgi:hypothetical protein